MTINIDIVPFPEPEPRLADRVGELPLPVSVRVSMAVTELDMNLQEYGVQGAVPESFIVDACRNWRVPADDVTTFRNTVVLDWNDLCASRRHS